MKRQGVVLTGWEVMVLLSHTAEKIAWYQTDEARKAFSSVAEWAAALAEWQELHRKLLEAEQKG